ncbi:hypothetical protein RHSIM_Rhsim04G0200300 [Rhododendron simsii]|uniref:Peptidase S1 domain-containing protein n=1 Tax=Rhododendron simsii TaxID=118357 RepID=A0A834LQK0_RHOSS|nr:hypothetical protein RHSIM_Rhsim04G0200300 [Rhododendron simsii]
MKIDWASKGVYRSLVGLAIHHCGKVSQVFSGTVVHPDGIIATSANCLKPLEGTEFEISVKLLHSRDTYKGVLLEADFCSNIAFVKVIPGHRLTAATFGKLDSKRDNSVVAVYFSILLDDGGSIDQEMENTESRNERKSGQLIKAESCIRGPLVNLDGGFIGIIHNVGHHFEATPIDDVFQYLEHMKKHGYVTYVVCPQPIGLQCPCYFDCGKVSEISVKLLHSRDTYKGVLLEADFCSNIAFVKVIPGHTLTATTFGKLDSKRDNSVVAVYFSILLDDGGSIDQEMENTESRNERKSGQLIKAESCIWGPLVNLDGGFIGIIHNVGHHFEAIPIDDVFQYLEHMKKHGYVTYVVCPQPIGLQCPCYFDCSGSE